MPDKTPILLLASLCLALCAAPAWSQAPPPAWSELLQQASGVDLGLAIREINALEGRPFDHSLLERPARPHLAAEITEYNRNFLIMEDTGGQIRSQTFADQRPWQEVLRLVYDRYPDRFDMVMVLTQWQSQIGAAYYLPLANDTRGIGYQNIADGVEVFNQTGSQLDGLIFMNYYGTYVGANEVLGRVVFLQEIGHRWGSFIRYDSGQGRSEDHLGRDIAHWSFFMNSRNSALEGNDWRDNGNGNFTTQTDAYNLTFSDLDLYLMGMLPPEQVEPFFLIEAPNTRGQRDQFGRALNAASPPSFNSPVTVGGTRKNIQIEDVIRQEGPRSPDWTSSQKTWRIATVVITNPGQELTSGQKSTIAAMLDQWELWFEESTRNQADLILDLEDLPAPEPTQGLGESCQSNQECLPDQAPACVASDQGRVCSRLCANDAECGVGFCCAQDFCYPNRDSQCAIVPDPGNNDPGDPGNNDPGDPQANNDPGNNDPGDPGNNDPGDPGNNDPGDPQANNDPGQDQPCDGFVEDCACQSDGFVDECQGSATSSGASRSALLCQSARPGAPSPTWPLALALGLALWAWRRGA